jgi:hypothetical protein
MKSFFNGQLRLLAPLLLLIFWTISVPGQTGAFTYQGRLTDNAPQGGNYWLRFELYDAAEGGTPIDALADLPVTVVNGVFTVELNFTASNAFDGGERFLQISVRRSAAENYVTLNPRQRLTSAPYAVRALTAENALRVGGTPASELIREDDARLSDARTPVAGSGDYIQNQALAPQVATSFNISGTGTAAVFNAATQFNVGGQRILSIPGNGNLFVGAGAGASNDAGQLNSFFGASAGNANTSGGLNAIFGVNAGLSNTTGSFNSFFGVDAGRLSTEGNLNAFFGRSAGQNNTTGGNNSSFGGLAGLATSTGGNNAFFGYRAGIANTTGSNNTVIGSSANVGGSDLSFATAVGSGAIVSTSNTLVLGRSLDTVQVPGGLNIIGAFGAGTINASTQYNLGGSRMLFATSGGITLAGKNTGLVNVAGFVSFFGEAAGANNTTGSHNAFFGSYSGESNTTGVNNAYFGADAGKFGVTGSNNAFFGVWAGFSNTAAENTFVGAQAGYQNTAGTQNVFVGRDAGTVNTTGSNNTFLGFNARPAAGNLNFAAAIGSGALVSTSNTIVLGRSAGQDTVEIPGALKVAGTFQANILNAAAQFNIGGQRFLLAPAGNTFAGFEAGRDNTTGDRNAFFGNFAGTSNTTGGDNSFFGREAGNRTTTGNSNSFFGFASGYHNTTGEFNTFVGRRSGINSLDGSSNTFIGSGAGDINESGGSNTIIGAAANLGANNLTNATAIGANAVVSASNSLVLGDGTVNVGIGTASPDARLQVNGGDIYVGNPGAGVILRSGNGSCFRLVVNNSGVLGTQPITCPQ